LLQFRRRWPLAVGALVVLVGVLAWQLMSLGSRSPGGSGAADKRVKPGAAGDSCSTRPDRLSAGIADRYDRQVMSLSPVLYLPLAGSSAGAVEDLARHGHQGTYVGGPPPGAIRLPNGDSAMVFDGRGQYVEVPSAATLSITHTGCLTVEAWIRPSVLEFPSTEGSGYVYILGKGESGKQEYALRMYSLTNSEVPPRPNRISAYVFNLNGGKGSGSYFQDNVTPDQWMMISFVVDSRRTTRWPEGYIAIYKNGVMRGPRIGLNQFGVIPQSSDAPFRVGTRDLESYFDGAIGKVAVYDSALSSQDISETYAAMSRSSS
jgi:Concanavalin A-like lectin/glucanases superfamily